MRYEPDHRGTRRDVLNAEGVAAEVDRRAEVGADYARARAPVRTGYYRSTIQVQHRQRAGDRTGAIVFADAHYAWEVEQHRHVFAGIVDIMEHA